MQIKKLHRILFLGILSLLIFIIYREHYCVGDSLIYADNILRQRFNDISLHIGYYCLGYLFRIILMPLVSGIDQVLIIMSALFGSVAAIYAYLLTEKLFGDSRLAVFSSLFLFLSGGFIANSVGAEIYSVQAAFILASLYYFFGKKYIVAGAIFGFSVLISPLSLFVGIQFPYLWLRRQCSLREFIRFKISALIIFLPVFLPLANEFLWGRRGLLKIATGTSYLNLGEAFGNIALTFAKSFHVFSIIIPIGLIWLFIKKRQLFWIVIVLNLAHFYLALKATEAGVLETFLVPIFFTYAICIAAGIWYSLELILKASLWKNIIMITAIIAFGLISLLMRIGPAQLMHPRLVTDHAFKNELRAVSHEIDSGLIVVTSFSYGVAYAFYTRTDPAEELEATIGNRRWKDIDYLTPADFGKLFQSYDNVYALESYSPGPATELLLNAQKLQARFDKFSLKARLKAMRGDLDLGDYRVGTVTHFYKLTLEDRNN